MGAREPRRWSRDGVRVVALVAALALHAVWVLSVHEAWGTAELLRRDWWVFWDAGRRLVGGDLAGIYAPRPGGFPFLHPPYVIVASAPLGALSGVGAYGVMLAVQAVCAGVATLFARRLTAERRGGRDLLGGATPPGPARGHPDRVLRDAPDADRDLVWLGVLASAPWAISLVLGQPSALLLASWLGGFWAWRRGRPFVAGLLFAVAAFKPPFVIAPLALALVARRRRVLAGLAAGLVGWLALSIPAGLERWPEWLAALARLTGELGDGRVALWKQHTWLAFLRSVAPGWLAWTGWAAVALPVGAWTLWRVREPERLGLVRAAGILALATVALGPYAYFYDALLLAIPAGALWLARDRYRRAWPLALAAVATFAWQHVGFFALQRGPAVGGALTVAWLLLELAAGPSADHRVRELDGEQEPDALELGGQVVGER